MTSPREEMYWRADSDLGRTPTQWRVYDAIAAAQAEGDCALAGRLDDLYAMLIRHDPCAVRVFFSLLPDIVRLTSRR